MDETHLGAALPSAFATWFRARGWSPRRHQLEVIAAVRRGRDTLLIAPTGGGKTLAGFLPSLIELATRRGTGIHT
ncbi:MAG: DEAD/DEAH box helicase, partial [Aestuariivirgaceae bacterium]